jgi:uncharacterized protein (TIGR02246 family)
MAPGPEEIHRRFEEAFNRHDLEAVIALYEPHAVLLTNDGPAHGLEAIREAYRRSFAVCPTIAVRTLAAVQSEDGLALLHGKWSLDGNGPDGAEIHTEGRNTELVRRQPDGRWRFVIDNPSVPQD